MEGTQLTLGVTLGEVMRRVRNTTAALTRDVCEIGLTECDAIDDASAEAVTRHITIAVDELQRLAADLMAPGYVDPRQQARADLDALHEIHGMVGQLDRNLHLYLDGRATGQPWFKS